MGFLGNLKDFLLGISPEMTSQRPNTKVEHIRGKILKDCRPVIYNKILIVDDVPRYAEISLSTIRDHFTFAELTVYMAYSYAAARQVFHENDIKLVIIDCDLDDEEGDGEMLTKEFLFKDPKLKILANSSRTKFNKKLLNAGAIIAIDKNPKQLLHWLKVNCRC